MENHKDFGDFNKDLGGGVENEDLLFGGIGRGASQIDFLVSTLIASSINWVFTNIFLDFFESLGVTRREDFVEIFDREFSKNKTLFCNAVRLGLEKAGVSVADGEIEKKVSFFMDLMKGEVRERILKKRVF